MRLMHGLTNWKLGIGLLYFLMMVSARKFLEVQRRDTGTSIQFAGTIN